MHINTKCVQSGYEPKNGEPRVVPIVHSTTFKYDTAGNMGDLFDLKASGFFYTRLANPTVDAVEKKLADLEATEPKTEKERLENNVKIATLKNGIYDAKEELKRVGSLFRNR